MLHKIKSKAAVFLGASACGCGASAPLLVHPCWGHAVAALVVWGLGFWAWLKSG